MSAPVELAPPAGGADPSSNQWEKFIVMNQDVEVEANFQEKSLSGFVKITVFPLGNLDIESVRIDARQMIIYTDKVTVNGKKVRAIYHDPYDHLEIPSSFDWDAQQYPYQQKRIAPLLDRSTPDMPIYKRDASGCCAPSHGSLEVFVRPEEEKAKKFKIKVASRQPDMTHFDIIIPFRSRPVRDGFHFVGVEETDTRYPHFYTRNSSAPGVASSIFPCIDDPGARSYWSVKVKIPRTVGDALRQPLVTQRATSKTSSAQPRFALTEEDKLLDMTVISAGLLVGEEIDKRDETKKIMSFLINDQQLSVHHVGFAVGPFQDVDLWTNFRTEAEEDKLGRLAINVYGYCLPGREDEVRYTCEAMSSAADFFATKFNKYPFGSYKMCFVDDMVSDTIPLCSLSLCSTRLLFSHDVIDKEIDVTRELVHALACQYFGVYIIPNTPLDRWITIGTSHYMTDLFMQDICGNNHYRFQMKVKADKLVEEDVNRLALDELGNYVFLDDHQLDFMNLKAPLVLFILDKRLTKKATHNGLRRVIWKLISKTYTLGDNDSRVISSDTLRKACEKVSHNSASLELFWQQWVHSSGCARFEMSQRYNKKHSRVDLTVKQPEEKSSLNPPPLTKENFWGTLQEMQHVPANKKEKVSVWFTGPITIAIHEANGTPYEHVAEIRRTGPKTFKTIEMPYNTKYKRLKRTRRLKERAMAVANTEGGTDQAEEAVLYSLGDVLLSTEEESSWGFAEWTAEQQKSMEQDSFEWLRIDSDFEWICSMKTNMQPWMYVSQLQQDRDVVAQQDSVLWLSHKAGGKILATFLGRTLMDTRYFHGIRTQAIRALQKQVWPREEEVIDPDTGAVHTLKRTEAGGLRILMNAFKTFFCYPDTQTPRPNNFSDKMQYFVQRAIPEAIANVRDKGRCPPEAQRFLLEQLRFNNNAENEYSDNFYVAGLLDALATSLVPEATETVTLLRPDDDPSLLEEKAFLEEALTEIERYLRMDEWTNSYQNILTVTALGCKQKLMKGGVIPLDPIVFVRYIQDGTLDLVVIKAFEALVDLGYLLHPRILRLLLAFMTTHYSPYVRNRLFKVFASGMAGLAFGEYEDLLKSDQESKDDDSGALMMENADAILEKKRSREARKTDMNVALAELRKEFSRPERQDLAIEMWRAVCSPVIGLAEQWNLLNMCEALFDPDYSCRVTVRHPTMWHAERDRGNPRRVLFKAIPRQIQKKNPEPLVQVPTVEAKIQPGATAVSHVIKTESKVASPPQPTPPPPIQRAPSMKITLKNTNKIRADSTGPSAKPTRPHPASPAPKTPADESVSYYSPSVVQASTNSAPSGLPSSPAHPPARTPLASAPVSNGISKKPKPSIKRKHEDSEVKSPRPRKIVKFSVPGYHKKVRPDTMTQILQEQSSSKTGPSARGSSDSRTALPTAGGSRPPGSITAKPPIPGVRKPLPSGPSSLSGPVGSSLGNSQQRLGTPKVRKPLPSGPASGAAASVLPPLDPQKGASSAAKSMASPSPASTIPKIKIKIGTKKST